MDIVTFELLCTFRIYNPIVFLLISIHFNILFLYIYINHFYLIDHSSSRSNGVYTHYFCDKKDTEVGGLNGEIISFLSHTLKLCTNNLFLFNNNVWINM